MAKDEIAGDVSSTSATEFANLPRGAIVRSRTNPRTHFDDAWIQELATSIRDHGIAQPLLVRPLPAARVQETFEDRMPGDPLPTHEIVCGECRYRAAGVAGLATVPVMVRQLSDVQVLQIQLVENLKRKDLHPLEEAEGFHQLMEKHGLTVEDIAAKVDKSASQIYVTLKLLDLTKECREELYKGTLTRSLALLVARAPQELQARIAKDIMTGPYDTRDEPMSYREAKTHIQQHYMLQLGAAVFDIKDASLVAKAGSCTDCQKRTGANRTLFGDIDHADTCTDPKCFDRKKEAHHAAVAAKAAAAGKTVIQGKAAKELITYAGAEPKGYKLLDKKEYIEGRTVSVRGAIGKENLADVKTVLIVDPFTKETHEAIKADVAGTLLSKAKKRIQADKATKGGWREPSEHGLKKRYEEGWQAKALAAVGSALLAGKMQQMTVDLARHIAIHFSVELYGDSADVFAKLFGCEDLKVATSAGIEQYLTECPADRVAPAMLFLMLNDEFSTAYNSTKFPVLDLLAAGTSVDVKSLQQEVKAEMKAEAAERKPKVQPPAAKGAAARNGNRKPAKTTQAEASAGIAEALQKAAKHAPKAAKAKTPKNAPGKRTANWPFPTKADAGTTGAGA